MLVSMFMKHEKQQRLIKMSCSYHATLQGAKPGEQIPDTSCTFLCVDDQFEAELEAVVKKAAVNNCLVICLVKEPRGDEIVNNALRDAAARKSTANSPKRLQ